MWICIVSRREHTSKRSGIARILKGLSQNVLSGWYQTLVGINLTDTTL